MQQAQAAVAAAGWYPGYMMPGVGMPGMVGVPPTGAVAPTAGGAGGTVVASAGPVPATGFAPGFDSRSCRGLYVGNLDTKVKYKTNRLHVAYLVTSKLEFVRQHLLKSLCSSSCFNQVTDMLLYEIFSTIGLVESCKVIKDKV